MKRVLLLTISLLSAFCVYAQSSVDSVKLLDEVEVKEAPFTKYTTGANVVTFDKEELSANNDLSLSDWLLRKTSIQLKELGSGMLSTVSIRGGSPSHTALLWNGVNLNSYTLGQADYNQFPLFFVDEINVQTGGASAMYGSDAVSGSVHLNTSPTWLEGNKLTLKQSYGSFDNWFSGIKYKTGNKKWENHFKLFYQSHDNDFTFINTAKYGQPEEVQDNAGYTHLGALNELYYRLSPSSYISSSIWYQRHHREIQPTMGNNLNPDTYRDEKLLTEFVKVVTTYRSIGISQETNVRLVYNKDLTVYKDDRTTAHNFQLDGAVDMDIINDKLTVKTGGRVQHIYVPLLGSDDLNINVSETRADAFVLTKYRPVDFYMLSVNLRQSVFDGSFAPFSPSIGQEIILLNHKHLLKLRNQISKNYRIPTFNDRYWPKQATAQGNPDLLAEDGMTYDIGLDYQFKQKRVAFQLNATAYQSKINNWILWMPLGGVWIPQNRKEVEITGVELFSSLQFKPSSEWLLELGGNYALTKAIIKEGVDDSDVFIGKQAPYTPEHNFSSYFAGSWDNWSLTFNQYYIGERTTTNIMDVLDGYSLLNIGLSKDIDLGDSKLQASLRANNIFDTTYENAKKRAMPKRNYMLSLVWSIHKD